MTQRKANGNQKDGNERAGELDASIVAQLFGVTKRTLAEMLHVDMVDAFPSNTEIQVPLQKAKCIYDTLAVMMPTSTIASWMRQPLRSVGGLTAVDLAKQHGIESLHLLVSEMVAGGYS